MPSVASILADLDPNCKPVPTWSELTVSTPQLTDLLAEARRYHKDPVRMRFDGYLKFIRPRLETLLPIDPANRIEGARRCHVARAHLLAAAGLRAR